MKRIIVALLMLGSLAACDRQEQVVTPSATASYARIGVEPAKPPVFEEGEVNPSMLGYVNGWPPKSPNYYVAAFHAYPTAYAVPVKFPLKVYVNHVYQGTILRPSLSLGLYHGQLAPNGLPIHPSQYLIKKLSPYPIDPHYNVRVYQVQIEDSLGKRWGMSWYWGAHANDGFAPNVHPTTGWDVLP